MIYAMLQAAEEVVWKPLLGLSYIQYRLIRNTSRISAIFFKKSIVELSYLRNSENIFQIFKKWPTNFLKWFILNFSKVYETSEWRGKKYIKNPFSW